MSKKKHSASSNQWLHEHFNDPFVAQAQKKGYRSRATFKLEAIAQKEPLFKPGMLVVDLGAAPGGWSQYAAQAIGPQGRVIACDLLAMDPIDGVDFLQGDFTHDKVLEQLLDRIGERRVDVVLSDMAPNFSGHRSVDQPRSMYLVELALEMCHQVLSTQGSLVVKVFQGAGSQEFQRQLNTCFDSVKVRKPEASRARSAEIYLIARGYQPNR